MVLQIIVLMTALHAALIDSYHRVLPNTLTLFIAALGVSNCLLNNVVPHPAYWICTAFHFALGMMYPSGFGMGDVKLLAGLGLFLQDSNSYLAWVMLSYSSSLVWALLRRLRSLAFGPHIVLAWIIISVGDYSHVSIPDGW